MQRKRVASVSGVVEEGSLPVQSIVRSVGFPLYLEDFRLIYVKTGAGNHDFIAHFENILVIHFDSIGSNFQR